MNAEAPINLDPVISIFFLQILKVYKFVNRYNMFNIKKKNAKNPGEREDSSCEIDDQY